MHVWPLALLAVVVCIIAFWPSKEQETFQSLPEFIGKRIRVVDASSSATSSADTVVLVTRNGRIVRAPVIVTPRISKYTGRLVSGVMPSLVSKFGERRVIAQNVNDPVVVDPKKHIIIMTDRTDTVQHVHIPRQWHQVDDMPLRKVVKELVGKRPVVVENGAAPRNPTKNQVVFMLRSGRVIDAPVLT